MNKKELKEIIYSSQEYKGLNDLQKHLRYNEWLEDTTLKMINRDEDFFLDKIKISKKQFKDIIKSIKKQYKYDRECQKAFKIILPQDHIIGYDNSIIVEGIIELLSNLTNDESDWIRYWIYELDFGKKWKLGTITEKDKSDVPLKTINDLWNILNKKLNI